LAPDERFLGELDQAFGSILSEGTHTATAPRGENYGTHRLSVEKSRKQGNIIRGEWIETFGMPHYADHTTIRVPDSLDNSIIGNGPADERRDSVHGSEIVKAIYFYPFAIDRNTLLRRHMAANRL
jgi:hypothetical protein